MNDFNKLYEELLEAMDRRQFLKMLSKGAAATAGSTAMPSGLVGNVLKGALGGKVDMEKLLLGYLQPERFFVPNGKTLTNAADIKNAIDGYKNNLSQIFSILASKRPSLENAFKHELKQALGYANNCEHILTHPNNDTKHFDSSVDQANCWLTHIYDDRQNYVLDNQVIFGLMSPQMRADFKQKYNIDAENYGVGKSLMSEKDVENYFEKQKQMIERLEKQRKEWEEKRKQIEKEQKEKEELEKEEEAGDKDIDYSRMDTAGGSEDVGYAQTFEKFFIENYADGKKPGRKGLAKRSGVNCKQSVSKLRKVAKNSSGERQRMAHWCANMKAGKKKKK